MRERGLRWIQLSVVLTVLGAGAPTWLLAGEQPLSVCVLDNNLPYASRASASGIDVDLARALARERASTLSLEWRNNNAAMTEIDESDFPLARLQRGQCDAVFSIPGPAEKTFAAHSGLALGESYYGAAFELVTCAGQDAAPAGFADLKGRGIAIQSQTVAHFALLKLGAEPRSYFSVDSALQGVVSAEAEHGLLWGPTVGWSLHQAQASQLVPRDPRYVSCRLLLASPPRALRWNLHIATRSVDKKLRAELDRLMLRIRKSGEMNEILARYGVPVREPFAATYSADAIEELTEPAP